MIEDVYIPVARYYAPNGDHTCALNFETGEVCQFYLTAHFGTVELCGLCRGADGLPSVLRRDTETSYLIHLPECPLWK